MMTDINPGQTIRVGFLKQRLELARLQQAMLEEALEMDNHLIRLGENNCIDVTQLRANEALHRTQLEELISQTRALEDEIGEIESA